MQTLEQHSLVNELIKRLFMRHYQEHSDKHQPRIDFYEKYENKTLNSTLAQATLVLINRDIANDCFI